MTEQLKIFFFLNLTWVFHFYQQLLLMAGHAGVLADWNLLTGGGVLSFMSQYDFDRFRQISQTWWTFAQAGNLPWAAGNI